VSPLETERSPPVKSLAENNVPDVPDATLQRKAPAIVAVALILNDALLAVLVTTEGLAVVAAAKVAAGRLPEYAELSVHPA
jgi:hypothetical protein